MFDGDTIFCLATGKAACRYAWFFGAPQAQALNDLEELLRDCLSRAIIRECSRPPAWAG